MGTGADVGSPQRRENLDAVASGKHQVEHDQVEGLGVHPKEAVLARCGDDDFVVFRIEAFLHGRRYLGFVFDHQDPHGELAAREYANITVPTLGPS